MAPGGHGPDLLRPLRRGRVHCPVRLLPRPAPRPGGRTPGGRGARVLPAAGAAHPAPYFFTLALSLLLIGLALGHKSGTLWDTCLPLDAKGLLTHLFLVQDLARGENSKINYPLWSISVEWRIYFLFPLLMALRRRWGAALVAAAALAVAYVLVLAGKTTPLGALPLVDLSASAPQYIGLFALGILGADIAYGRRGPFPLLRRRAPALALLGATTLLMLAASGVRLGHGGVLPLPFRDFFVGLWAVALLLAAACPETVRLRGLLSWRPLVSVGTFAYSLYLIHAPLIQLLWQYAFVPLHGRPPALFLAFTFVGMPLIVGASYLFFLACERPFLTRRKRETVAETERDAALSPAP